MIAPHVWPLTAAIQNNQLTIGGCRLADLAAAYGTPLYIFDEATIRSACRAYRHAFRPYTPPVQFSYAGKAWLNVPIARLILAEGFGFDVVSLGEMQLALRAGAKPENLHLHGNAKPAFELEQALAAGIGRIVVDNLDELRQLAALSRQMGVRQKIWCRIEPAVAAATHKKIQTGQKNSKFGLPLSQLDAFVAAVKAAPGLTLSGLHFHLGSQIFDTAVYLQAVQRMLDLMAHLRDEHQIDVAEISPGGGLAAPYRPSDHAPAPDVLAGPLIDLLLSGCRQKNLPLPALILEPGRSITARSGVALYRVISTKPIAGHSGAASRFLHVDGGMGDNLRPALYGAQYTAVLANRCQAEATETVHISGRFCESGDLLVRDARLPKAETGDLIALATAGAYTLSMANNYNMVPRPAVVLVNDGQARLIQRRETFADMVRRDII